MQALKLLQQNPPVVNCECWLTQNNLCNGHEMVVVLICYFVRGSCCKVMWWICLSVGLSVCLSVCLSAGISPQPHARSLPNFLHMFLVSVARCMMTIGHIVYHQEGVFFPTDNAYISGTSHAIFTNFLCILPVSVPRSSSNMFAIGRIAYRRNRFSSPLKMHYRPGKGDGSAQCGQSMLSTIALLLLCCVVWMMCCACVKPWFHVKIKLF